MMRKLATMTAAAALAFAVGGLYPAPASADLVGYWAFDDELDPTADATINANNGTLGDVAGADGDDPAYACGAGDFAPTPGNACSLDFATGDFVRVADTTDLEPVDVTVSAWVRNNGAPTSYDYILAKTLDGGKASYAFYTQSSGGLRFYASGGTYYLSDDAGTGIWDGNWHHIAGVYDSSGPTVHLFVDGAEVGTANAGPASISYASGGGYGDLTIGTYNEVGIADWIGNIDEVRIYDRALSEPEIALLKGLSDPTGDTDNEEIDVQLVQVTQDDGDLACTISVASSGPLKDKSTFRCHIDFDDDENATFAGKGCDLDDEVIYSLGDNSLCTTSDITLTYRQGRSGGECTGTGVNDCVVDDSGNEVVITITADLDAIANVRDTECDPEECLTNKDGNGDYDVYMFFDAQWHGDRDHIPDTDDNRKPNATGEAVIMTLHDPTL